VVITRRRIIAVIIVNVNGGIKCLNVNVKLQPSHLHAVQPGIRDEDSGTVQWWYWCKVNATIYI
jgi:hypothetical protein